MRQTLNANDELVAAAVNADRAALAARIRELRDECQTRASEAVQSNKDQIAAFWRGKQAGCYAVLQLLEAGDGTT